MAQETLYTATNIFPLDGGRFGTNSPDVPLRVITNGGSITVSVLAGGERDDNPTWVSEAAITVDGTYMISVQRSTIRIQSAGGAQYSFPEK